MSAKSMSAKSFALIALFISSPLFSSAAGADPESCEINKINIQFGELDYHGMNKANHGLAICNQAQVENRLGKYKPHTVVAVEQSPDRFSDQPRYDVRITNSLGDTLECSASPVYGKVGSRTSQTGYKIYWCNLL